MGRTVFRSSLQKWTRNEFLLICPTRSTWARSVRSRLLGPLHLSSERHIVPSQCKRPVVLETVRKRSQIIATGP